MTFTREQAHELAGRRRANGFVSKRTTLEMLAQQAVTAQNLTGNPLWDTYLSYLQAAVEREKTALETLTATLTRPDLVNADAIMTVRIALHRCQERIWAWESAMALPKLLVEGGKAATAQLDDILKRTSDA